MYFDGAICPGNWCSIRSSFNISGVYRNSTGSFSIYFASPMVDVNYAAVMSNNGEAATGNCGLYTDNNTNYFNIRCYNSGGVPYDMSFISGAVFR